MKKKAVLVFASVVLFGSWAWAGYQQHVFVGVYKSQRQAYGELGTARNSPNSIEYIACFIIWDGTTKYAQCQARDGSGTYATCLSTSAAFVQVAASVQGDSMIVFNWDANGDCTYISVENGSDNDPKQP